MFEQFLSRLPDRKGINNASPLDVKRFLVWKDQSGKTKIPGKECKYFGKTGEVNCDCTVRLASSSVANMIQHLVDIFNRHRHGRTYDNNNKIGNPAASVTIKQYVKCIKEE